MMSTAPFHDNEWQRDSATPTAGTASQPLVAARACPKRGLQRVRRAVITGCVAPWHAAWHRPPPQGLLAHACGTGSAWVRRQPPTLPQLAPPPRQLAGPRRSGWPPLRDAPARCARPSRTLSGVLPHAALWQHHPGRLVPLRMRRRPRLLCRDRQRHRCRPPRCCRRLCLHSCPRRLRSLGPPRHQLLPRRLQWLLLRRPARAAPPGGAPSRRTRAGCAGMPLSPRGQAGRQGWALPAAGARPRAQSSG